MKAYIKDGWIICENCGHKLAKIKSTGELQESNSQYPKEEQTEYRAKLEFKCSSCKTINGFDGEVFRL